MQLQNDQYYIQQTLQGNMQQYAFLVNKYKNMAYTLAIKMLHNPEDAEEVAQDSFVKAYQNLRDFKGSSKFSTWLFRIVYTQSVSKLRKKKQFRISINDEKFSNFDVAETDSLIRQITDAEQAEMVRNAIDRLPEDESALITLYYFNENSVEEISEITGLSVSNSKVKLHRARKKLWAFLKTALDN